MNKNFSAFSVLARSAAVAAGIVSIFAGVASSAICTDYSSSFAGGDGSQESPFQITAAQGLQNVDNVIDVSEGCYFRLQNGINLTEYLCEGCTGESEAGAEDGSPGAGYNNGAGWLPVNLNAHKLDGNGKRIIGLWINRPETDDVGLFSASAAGSEIKNIGVEIDKAKGGVNGRGSVGGLVGYNRGTVRNSYSTGSVSGANSHVGGLIGYNYNGTVRNSYSAVAVSNGSFVGGLAGRNDGTINNSYSIGRVSSGGSYVSGLVGYGSSANSYYDTETSGIGGGKTTSQMKTQSTYPASWDFVNNENDDLEEDIWDIAENSYPFFAWQPNSVYMAGIAATAPQTFTGNSITPKPKVSVRNEVLEEGTHFVYEYENNYQPGVATIIVKGVGEYAGQEQRAYFTILSNSACETGIANGAGTAANPYKISTAGELQALNFCLGEGNKDKYFELQNDIDLESFLANSSEGWLPIGSSSEAASQFYGHFNGNFFAVKNLWINRPSTDYIGLFGVNGGEIKNIGVEIDNAKGGVNGNGDVGGLTGHNGGVGVIFNSYATGNVSGSSQVGGLVGTNNGGTVSNSYATENVSGSGFYVGGLIGNNYSNSTVSNSYSTGNVSGSGFYVGGLTGNNYSNSTVSNSYSTGNVSGNSYLGGLIGNNVGSFVSSYYWTGSIEPNDAGKGDAKSATNLKKQITFVDWDFETVWEIDEGVSYPTLWWQNKNHLGRAKIAEPESFVWDGAAKTPTPKVYMGETELTAGDDFDYAYSNNIMVGDSAIVKIVGKGTYSGTQTSYFSISTPTCGASLFAGGTGTSANPYQISNARELDAVRFCIGANNSGLNFKLTADIDLTNYIENSNNGWMPIGTDATNSFQGKLDGNGKVVSGLWVNRPGIGSEESFVYGLFGFVYGSSAEIKKLGVEINNSKGGIAGDVQVGGIAGLLKGGTISESYVKGNISGRRHVGGITGWLEDHGKVENSYVIGDITDNSYVGGIASYTSYYGTVANSYFAGTLAGSPKKGIQNSGSIIQSFYDSDVSEFSDTDGGTPKTTAEMKTQSTFADWDFETVWEINPSLNSGYPILIWQNPNNLLNAEILPVASQEYTGSALTPEPVVKMGATTLEKDVDYELSYTNNVSFGAATITITGIGAYSNSRKITFQITKTQLKSLSLSQSGITYGETLPAYELTGNESGGAETASYTIKDANSYSTTKPTNAGDYTIKVSVAATSNYEEGYATADFSISKAAITLAVSQGNVEYGKNISEPVLDGNLGGASIAKKEFKTKDAGDETFTEDIPTEIGHYTIKVTVGETANYLGASASAEFEITKINPPLTISQSGIIYGEYLPDPEISGVPDGETAVVEYAEHPLGAEPIWSKEKPANAGVYVVRVSVGETQNYSAFSKTAEFSIAKITLFLTISQEGATYNENLPDPVIGGIPDGAAVTIEYASAGTPLVWGKGKPAYAGSYFVRASIEENENYVGAFSKTAGFTIEKANPPTLNNPEITLKTGDTLKNIALPEQWSWSSPNAVFTFADAGKEKNPTAVFTPNEEQSANYNLDILSGWNSGSKTIHRSLAATVAFKADSTVVIPIADKGYTGKEVRPLVLLGAYIGKEKVILPSSAYTVSYSNNVNRGQASAEVSTTGIYEGILLFAKFNITDAATPILSGGYGNADGVGFYSQPSAYYTLKGVPLGNSKPKSAGVYVEKIYGFARIITVR